MRVRRRSNKNSYLDARRYTEPTRLIYPVPISSKTNGRIQPKTWAFIHLGGEEHQRIHRLEIELKKLNQKVSRYSSFDPRLEPQRDRLLGELKRARLLAAEQSPYFLKTLPPSERAVRERLRLGNVPIEEPLRMRNVPIEKPIENMEKQKNGREERALELYERGGFEQVGSQYLANRFSREEWKKISITVGSILSSIHAAGVIHGHAHLGNFVFLPTSHAIKLIDFSRARLTPSPRSKNEFLKKFAHDMWEAAVSCSVKESNVFSSVKRLLKNWLLQYRKKMNTHGVTPEDILEYGERSRFQ
jgi:hypothetical protein